MLIFAKVEVNNRLSCDKNPEISMHSNEHAKHFKLP